MDYHEFITKSTLAALAKRGALGDLLDLLDAAYRNGGSGTEPTTAGGDFIMAIAKLAMKTLNAK